MTYVDPEGEIGHASMNIVNNASVPLTINGLQSAAEEFASKHAAMSNAQVRRISIAQVGYVSQDKPPAPTAADRNIEDGTFMELMTQSGKRISTTVPCALRTNAVYLAADLETVNPNASATSAFLTDAITGFADTDGNTWQLSTALGEPATSYIKGEHKRSKTRRKQRGGINTEIGG